MEGKVLGIPLAIIFFVFALGLVLGVPMFYFHNQEMKKMEDVKKEVHSVFAVKATPTPTIALRPSVSPSVSPTKGVVKQLNRVASPSAGVNK